MDQQLIKRLMRNLGLLLLLLLYLLLAGEIDGLCRLDGRCGIHLLVDHHHQVHLGTVLGVRLLLLLAHLLLGLLLVMVLLTGVLIHHSLACIHLIIILELIDIRFPIVGLTRLLLNILNHDLILFLLFLLEVATGIA